MTRARALGMGVLAIGLGLAGCSSSSEITREPSGGGVGGSGGGTGSGPELAEVPALYAEVACNVLPTCMGDFFLDYFLAGADCVTQTLREFEDLQFGSTLAAAADGRVEYHADQVQACLDGIEDLGCGLFASWYLPECEAALTGTVAEGGDCTLDDECEGDWFCQIDGSCPGTCTARLGAGQPCYDSNHCQVGLTCTDPPDGAELGQCAEPVGIGDACDEVTAPCPMGLLCLPDDSGGTACAELSALFSEAEGADCGPQLMQFCAEGLVCVTEQLSLVTEPTVTCQEPDATSGGDCNYAIPDECPSGEYCDVDLAAGELEGTCEPLPVDGEPCAPGTLGDDGRCAVYHQCINQTCRERQRIGGDCVHDDQCYSVQCAGGTCAVADNCSQ